MRWTAARPLRLRRNAGGCCSAFGRICTERHSSLAVLIVAENKNGGKLSVRITATIGKQYLVFILFLLH